jgi:ATP-dependent exoDNAse (exonuclease V) beta subunit
MSSFNAVVDEEHRVKARECLDKSFFVRAGAGTGKTKVLVERAANMLETKRIEPGELVMITFTEAAAEELAVRLRRELARRDKALLEGLERATICTLHSFARKILGELTGRVSFRPIVEPHELPDEQGTTPSPSGSATTYGDGRSARLILPPSFDVLDGSQEREYAQRRFSEYLSQAFNEPAWQSLLTLGSALGVSAYQLQETALVLASNWDRLLRPGAEQKESVFTLDLSDIQQELSMLEEALSAASCVPRPEGNKSRGTSLGGKPSQDGLVRELELIEDLSQLLGWLRETQSAGVLDELTGLAAMLRAVGSSPAGTKRIPLEPGARSVGAKVNWAKVPGGTRALEEARKKVEEVRLRREALLDLVSSKLASGYLELCRQFALQLADERLLAGRLSFHDLLVRALMALSENPWARAELSAKWKCLLVDEFQDTDPLQLDLVALLGSDSSRGGTSSPGKDPATQEGGIGHAVTSHQEDDRRFLPGRVVVVGDAQQSIYRFRRADVTVFNEAGSYFDDDGKVTLSVNFRSVPSIINWANRCFDLLGSNAQSAFSELAYEQVALSAYRDPLEADHKPAVHVLGECMEQVSSAAQLREEEANLVAAGVRKAIQECWLVQSNEEVTGGEETEYAKARNARYGDITVLIPSRTYLPPLLKAFKEAGIPYRLQMPSALWGTQIGLDVRNLLAAVADPTDAVSVLAAARSIFIGCSDAELREWVEAHGSFLHTENCACHGHMLEYPVARVFDWLQRMHETLARCSIGEALTRLAKNRRMFELLLSGPDGELEAGRLHQLLMALTRASQEEGIATLDELVAWIDTRREQRDLLPAWGLGDRAGDAVKVNTIHGAKGLEYPIVFLVGLDQEPIPVLRGDKARVIWDGQGQPFLRLGEARAGKTGSTLVETPGRNGARDHERAALALERLRLFYVAATRARDHLVVSMVHRPAKVLGSYESLAAQLWELSQPEGALFELQEALDFGSQSAPTARQDAQAVFGSKKSHETPLALPSITDAGGPEADFALDLPRNAQERRAWVASWKRSAARSGLDAESYRQAQVALLSPSRAARGPWDSTLLTRALEEALALLQGEEVLQSLGVVPTESRRDPSREVGAVLVREEFLVSLVAGSLGMSEQCKRAFMPLVRRLLLLPELREAASSSLSFWGAPLVTRRNGRLLDRVIHLAWKQELGEDPAEGLSLLRFTTGRISPTEISHRPMDCEETRMLEADKYVLEAQSHLPVARSAVVYLGAKGGPIVRWTGEETLLSS